MGDHIAATALRHWFAASARKVRSVDREMRWRLRVESVVDGGVHLGQRSLASVRTRTEKMRLVCQTAWF